MFLSLGLTAFVYYGRATTLSAKGRENVWMTVDHASHKISSPGMAWTIQTDELEEIVLLSGVSRDTGAKKTHYFFQATALKTKSLKLLPIAVWYSRRQKNSQIMLGALASFNLRVSRVKLKSEDRPWSTSFRKSHFFMSDQRGIPKVQEVQNDLSEQGATSGT